MSPDQIAALIAAVPGVAVLMWVVLRQQMQNDKLLDQLIAANKLLMDLHPPQSIETAKIIAEKPPKKSAEIAS